MKYIANVISKQDKFSQGVILNIGKKSRTNNSCLAGSLTILICLAVIFYTIICALKLYLPQQNFRYSNVQQLNIQQDGTVNLNQSQLLIFHQIQGSLVDKSLENLATFMDIYFQLEQQNYTDPKNVTVTTKRVEISWCTQNDFGFSQQAIYNFKQFTGLQIICPKLDYNDGFAISMNVQNTLIQKLNIVFHKCDKIQNTKCKTDEQISKFMQDFMITTYTQYLQHDFSKINQNLSFIKLTQLNQIYPVNLNGKIQQIDYFMRLNSINLYGNILNFGQSLISYRYYDISKKYENILPSSINVQYCNNICVAKFTLNLDNEELNHSIKYYDFFNILSEVGGFAFIMFAVFNFILQPFLQYNFKLEIMKQLYFARTLDLDIFKKEKANPQRIQNYFLTKDLQKQTNIQLENDFQNNKIIKLSSCNKILLFIGDKLGILICNCIFSQRLYKLMKLLKKGKEKLEDDLDITKIIKSIKCLQLLIKNQSNLTKEIQQLAEYAAQSSIDIDENQDVDRLLKKEQIEIAKNAFEMKTINYSPSTIQQNQQQVETIEKKPNSDRFQNSFDHFFSSYLSHLNLPQDQVNQNEFFDQEDQMSYDVYQKMIQNKILQNQNQFNFRRQTPYQNSFLPVTQSRAPSQLQNKQLFQRNFQNRSMSTGKMFQR